MRKKYTEPKTFELVRSCFNRNWGNDLKMTPFIKTRSWDSRFKCMSNLFTSTVTYGSFSFDLETRHFNIDILAEDIHNRLLEEKLPYYEHRISAYNELTEQYWKEHFYILGYALDRGDTFHNPIKNTYTTYYTLRNEGYSTKNPIQVHYTHIGNMDNYISGDFIKSIIVHCTSELYELSHDNDISQKIKRQLIKIFGDNFDKYSNKNKTFYSLKNKSYIHQFVLNNTRTYNYKFDGSYDDYKNINVLDYMKTYYPEAII